MERKEPTLNVNVSDHEPEPLTHEAIAAEPPARKPKKAAKPRPEPVYQPDKSSGSIVAVLALLVAIAAIGGGGYLAWKLQQTEALLESADARLQVLEKRLDFSDEESSQSVESIRVKLKWADSEIRKLWGVSHDKNRKAISANTSKLAKSSKQIATADKVSKAAKKLADSHEQQLSALAQSIEQDSAQLAELLAAFDKQRSRLQVAADKANKANTELARLRNSVEPRISENEEAIEAIDAYRGRVNRELNELKQRAGLQ